MPQMTDPGQSGLQGSIDAILSLLRQKICNGIEIRERLLLYNW